MPSNIRIGIDVGGTFTHAVALDGSTLQIMGKSKVPTTHTSAEGVARGIIDSLQTLLKETNISAGDVAFIAHSTTQATNALLEGDVAPVGIIGMGKGANAWLARIATDIQRIELAPGKYLITHHRFIDTSKAPSDEVLRSSIQQLVASGAIAIAVSEAFSVDEPTYEDRAVEIARELGLPATSGSEVSQMYGLKVRTRTAVINASMLPKMIESADMTERSVREAGIQAPIMIMRSDGGVMDIDAMRKRPILTMLSGPAAGVAAAMMYLHISDGIFLEVGGTSTDISAIRNGRALVKSAEVGGHRVYMRTLDVRTVGVAGGSMPRLRGADLIDVGPRSAHIAGLGYVSFHPPLEDARLHLIQPRPSDADDYVALSEGANQPSFCLTPTCSANLLELVPDEDCARGNREAIQKGFEALSKTTGKTPQQDAEEILRLSSKKCIPIVSQLMKDYKLDPSLVTLVGGGGGAAALVPFTARHMDMRHSLAQDADVISAIGVALALVRETIERQIVNPTSDDILRIREEAQVAVQKMGADPGTIEIHIEVDSRTNTVRATASGATELSDKKLVRRELSDDERLAMAADSMRVDAGKAKLLAQSDHYQVFGADTVESQLRGLFKRRCHSLRTLDHNGVIRLQTKDGVASETKANAVDSVINSLAEEHSHYGDAGKILPGLMLLAGTKIVDLSGLMDLGQINALAKIELETLPRDSTVIVIADLR